MTYLLKWYPNNMVLASSILCNFRKCTYLCNRRPANENWIIKISKSSKLFFFSLLSQFKKKDSYQNELEGYNIKNRRRKIKCIAWSRYLHSSQRVDLSLGWKSNRKSKTDRRKHKEQCNSSWWIGYWVIKQDDSKNGINESSNDGSISCPCLLLSCTILWIK